MPAPEVVIPLLEGIVGSISGGRETDAALFVKMCKEIMLATVHKDKTDWEFLCSEDIDESGNNVRNGVGTFYAALIGYNAATAAGDLIAFTNATSNTYDGTAALDAGDFLVLNLPPAATEDTEELHALLYPKGWYFGTGLTVGADAQGGANPAADDVRAWILYRTAA